MVFAVWIEHALDSPVQRPHDADACEHRRPADRRDKDQGFHRRLPFLGLMLGLRQVRDVTAGILEGDKLATARERDGFFKLSLPTPAANDAIPSCRIGS